MSRHQIFNHLQNIQRFATLLPLLLLPACVSVPLPPSGDKMGSFGRLEVGIRYFPPVTIDWFNPQIPSLKDK